MDADTIPTAATNIIPDAKEYEFGILSSSLHMAWMRAFAGRLEMRYRYSKDIVYNNFPWPSCTESEKENIERAAQKILAARASHANLSLADMYGDKMVYISDLMAAHDENDRAVLKAYGLKADTTEQEMVAELIKRYKKRIEQVEKEEEVAAAVKKVIGRAQVPSWLNELKEQCLRGEISVEDLIEKGKLLKRELSPKKPRKSVK